MAKIDLLNILRSDKTIFTSKDVLLSSKEHDPIVLKRSLNYYAKKGELYSIRRGFYAKDKNYDKNELATKIYTPSYISFETVLGRAGVTFQYYSQIFIASYKSVEIEVEGQKYLFKKIKDSILTNSAGIDKKENYSIASLERAFLDVIYLHKDYHFDNLRPLDWNKIYDILPIYGGNKRMEKSVKMYNNAFKNNLK